MRNEEVREAFRDFVLELLSFSFTGKVESVDEQNHTAKVRHGDLPYTVNFKSIQDNKSEGLWIVPAVGSDVFCVPEGQSKERFMIVKYSQIERIYFEIGDTKCNVSTDNVVFNDGENGGLAKVKELNDSVNSIKTYVEAINTALPNALNAIGAGTASSGAAGAASYTASMQGQLIEIKNFENTKIKH